jgi:methylmalonyl-CoA mutase
MEIAKFRAARLLWAKIVEELGGNNDSQKIHIRAINSLKNKSILDNQSNILRGTAEAMSAIFGGCEAITIQPFDIQTKKYQELSRRIARNTQLVLQYECNLTEVIDPAGGSYYIEALTNEILAKSFELLKVIDDKEGIINCIKSGFIQDCIAGITNQRILNFSTRKETIVGANKYPNLTEEISSSSIPQYNTNAMDHATKLKALPIIFKNSNSLDSIPVLPDYNISGEIVKLRLSSEKFKLESGHLPKVIALTFGSTKQYKGRYDFSKEFLSVGGIDLDFSRPFSGISDAAESFILSPNQLFVICSDDESYLNIVPELVKLIKSVKPDSIAILAGYPKEYIELFESAGIDIFIHLKSNIISTLQEIHFKLGLNK